LISVIIRLLLEQCQNPLGEKNITTTSKTFGWGFLSKIDYDHHPDVLGSITPATTQPRHVKLIWKTLIRLPGGMWMLLTSLREVGVAFHEVRRLPEDQVKLLQLWPWIRVKCWILVT